MKKVQRLSDSKLMIAKLKSRKLKVENKIMRSEVFRIMMQLLNSAYKNKTGFQVKATRQTTQNLCIHSSLTMHLNKRTQQNQQKRKNNKQNQTSYRLLNLLMTQCHIVLVIIPLRKVIVVIMLLMMIIKIIAMLQVNLVIMLLGRYLYYWPKLGIMILTQLVGL